MKSIIKETIRIAYFFAPIILFFVLSTMMLARDDMHLKVEIRKSHTDFYSEKKISGERVSLFDKK
jgi:hypothetical protein